MNYWSINNTFKKEPSERNCTVREIISIWRAGVSWAPSVDQACAKASGKSTVKTATAPVFGEYDWGHYSDYTVEVTSYFGKKFCFIFWKDL